jgi:KaiC/GvpD/RAD55 family RecA-like ATPase
MRVSTHLKIKALGIFVLLWIRSTGVGCASDASEISENTRRGYLVTALSHVATDWVERGRQLMEFQKGMDEGGVKWMAQEHAQKFLTSIGKDLPFSYRLLSQSDTFDGWGLVETHLVACLIDAMTRDENSAGPMWQLLPADLRRRLLRRLLPLNESLMAKIAPEVGIEMGLIDDYLNDRTDSYLNSTFNGLLAVAKTSPFLAEKVVKHALQATKVDRENAANAYLLVTLYRELPSQRRVLFEEIEQKMDELKTLVKGIAEEENLPMAKDEKLRAAVNEFITEVRTRLQSKDMEPLSTN